MKAVFINQHGGPEQLIYGDRPEPELGPGEVMLRVRASALNHLDIYVRTGRIHPKTLPRILGCDIAGEIVAIDSEAQTNLKVSDRVVLANRVECGTCENCLQSINHHCTNLGLIGVNRDGGHAEYVTGPARNAHKIPDSMSFTEAAALPIVGHTVWHCLITQAQIRPWDDVLVQAAGSGVGSMGIQLAKMVGARVITTAGSDWKLQKAKELGTDEVINYRETPNFSQRVRELTDGKGVDLVLDVVGADVWEESLRCLKHGGRLVITGTTSGISTSMDLSLLQGRPLHVMGSGGRGRRTFVEMMKMVHRGSLHGIVDRVFPLEEVAEAHRVMEARDFFGKLVVES